MRNLLLIAILGASIPSAVYAQPEEADLIPSKRREQQEKYERGEGLYPAKKRSNTMVGGYLGHSGIYGDVNQLYVWNGTGASAGGLNVEKALGHFMSLRFTGGYAFARGLKTQLNRGYAGIAGGTDTGVNGYYDNPFNSPTPGGSYFSGGVARPVAYNFASKMVEVSAMAMFHLGNINYYKEANRWDYYIGIGPGVMGYQTLVDAKQHLANGTYALYDFEAAYNKGVANAGAASGSFFTNWKRNNAVRKELMALLDGKGDYATVGGVAVDETKTYNYESDVETDAPIRWKTGKSNHVINIRPMINTVVGLRYKVSRRIELGLEQRMIIAGTDLLDGVRWTERLGNPRGVRTTGQDVWGHTVATLGFRIGKNGTDALWWMNPVNTLATANADSRKLMKGLSDDSDGDGVSDLFDKDPNTPEGVAVGGDGRALDLDKDGVADSQDDQIGTAAGASVDAKGIAKDSDKDGVPDKFDKESNTPSGSFVDANGREIKFPTLDCSKCAPVTPPAPIPTPTPVIVECNLPSVHFDAGSSVIKQDFYPDMYFVAKYMMDHTSSINVVGHDDKSDAIARKRAEAAVNFIVGNFGIDRSRFNISTSIGGGVNGNNSYKNPKVGPLDYLNRRVDFDCK